MFILKNLKTLNKILGIAVVFILILEPYSIYSEIPSKLIYDINSITGDWKDIIFLNRRVKVTDEIGKTSKIKIFIAKNGYYKPYLHIYYKWQETCPKIDFVIKNAGKKFRGSITLETNRVSPEMDGRWVFKVLEAPSLLYLNSGETEISLTLRAVASYWRQNAESNTSNGIVAVDYLIMQPVIFANGKIVSLGVIEAESFRRKDYSKLFDDFERLGILRIYPTNKISSPYIHIPFQSNFDIWTSVKVENSNDEKKNAATNKTKKSMERKTKLQIEISSKSLRFEKAILLDYPDTKWNLLHIGKINLEKGNYIITIKGLGPLREPMGIDFFVFIPIQE